MKKTQSFIQFIETLRRYRKSDIVNVGSNLIWGIFHEKFTFGEKKSLLISRYGPKIVTLALATANEYRNNKLDDVGFYNLCHRFLDIGDTISDKSFLESESIKILSGLKDKKFPSKYLDLEIIKNICEILFISRLSRQQYPAPHNIFYPFCMTYDVLLLLNNCTHGEVKDIFYNIFEVDFLQFIRAMVGIFTIANDNSKSGKILFKGLTCDEAVTKKWGVNIELCEFISSKVSYRESNVKNEWYKENLEQSELYKKHYPSPLYKFPMIKMDESKKICIFYI